MIYVMNILTNTRKGDAYDMVAINKFPIIYKTSRMPDSFLYDKCVIDQLKSSILNKITEEHAILYIRAVDDNMSFKDYKISVKEILGSAKKPNKEI